MENFDGAPTQFIIPVQLAVHHHGRPKLEEEKKKKRKEI